MKEKIGIIGLGNMGSAIAERIKSKYEILGFDKDKCKTEKITGIRVAGGIFELIESAPCAIILAVKPQDFDSLLNELRDFGEFKDLYISIAAGITTGYIEKYLGKNPVVRAMPNLPAKIGKGTSCLCKGNFASERDLAFSKDLFSNLGEVIILPEPMMNAATAISGSGPAYVCNYLESKKEKDSFLHDFQNAAELIGFTQEQSGVLVNTTFSGTIKFLKQTGISPTDLIKQVASKGGTTEAALKVLETGGTLEEAVKAAVKRAEELCRKE